MTKYNARYFIDKFAAIPEGMWCVGTYRTVDARRCALGHCGYVGTDTAETSSLKDLLQAKSSGVYVGRINDGAFSLDNAIDLEQLGDTPRERILNALVLVEAGIWREIV